MSSLASYSTRAAGQVHGCGSEQRSGIFRLAHMKFRCLPANFKSSRDTGVLVLLILYEVLCAWPTSTSEDPQAYGYCSHLLSLQCPWCDASFLPFSGWLLNGLCYRNILGPFVCKNSFDVEPNPWLRLQDDTNLSRKDRPWCCALITWIGQIVRKFS